MPTWLTVPLKPSEVVICLPIMAGGIHILLAMTPFCVDARHLLQIAEVGQLRNEIGVLHRVQEDSGF